MAANNTVNQQKMKQAATELSNIHANMDKQIKKLDETMNSVKKVWTGEAATTYLKSYQNHLESFKKMANAIMSASNAITQSATTYDQAESTAMDIVQKLGKRG
jgi:WXG100 family type VII secretion target